MLTFKSITLLRTLYVVSQVGRLVTRSHRVTSRWWNHDSHRCTHDNHRYSFVQFDWNIDICIRIVGWCHWSRVQVTTIATDITVLRLHHVRSWRRRHMRLYCASTIHVFHPDMFTCFQRSQVDHSVTFIKRFLLALLIVTLCLPCILQI